MAALTKNSGFIFEKEAESPRVNNPLRSTKTGRNDLCPCGSGKKYKKCCGR